MAWGERDHPSKPEVVVDGSERGIASRVNIAFLSRPVSLAFSVEQCSRGGKFVSPSRISSTLKGIPPLMASLSIGNSISSVLSVPKSAGIVDEWMLDQQLETAFQAGLRKSLDDTDHDAMPDVQKRMSMVAAWFIHSPLQSRILRSKAPKLEESYSSELVQELRLLQS